MYIYVTSFYEINFAIKICSSPSIILKKKKIEIKKTLKLLSDPSLKSTDCTLQPLVSRQVISRRSKKHHVVVTK